MVFLLLLLDLVLVLSLVSWLFFSLFYLCSLIASFLASGSVIWHSNYNTKLQVIERLILGLWSNTEMINDFVWLCCGTEMIGSILLSILILIWQIANETTGVMFHNCYILQHKVIILFLKHNSVPSQTQNVHSKEVTACHISCI